MLLIYIPLDNAVKVQEVGAEIAAKKLIPYLHDPPEMFDHMSLVSYKLLHEVSDYLD